MNNRKYVLIVAGGSGKRMNSNVPKQFILINGKPMLMHTFEAFYRFDAGCMFILVLPEPEIDNWKQLCTKFSFNIQHEIVAGGETRFHSVKNGLEKISDEGIVFIHDGVRPLVSQLTIENCYWAAIEKGNALPVLSPAESVRQLNNGQSKAVDRTRYFLVQTPQTFNVAIIKKAYSKKYSPKFTDDASVAEKDGIEINLVQGNRENIKITYPVDLIFAEALLTF
jgi:2-C-methyl-D-erythritol 4-phosphate cytidylyltransferase